jgi:hypothetical protein
MMQTYHGSIRDNAEPVDVRLVRSYARCNTSHPAEPPDQETARRMSTNPDHRKAAEEVLQAFTAGVEAEPPSPARKTLLDECAALAVAIRAFHMEGIRFRMFNVDRAIARSGVALTDETRAAFAEVRKHLEAAGFHTRSHQAPG